MPAPESAAADMAAHQTTYRTALGVDAAGAVNFAPFVTPAVLTTDQNNYAVNGAKKLRLATNGGTVNITGFAAQASGYPLVVVNVGATGSIVLADQDTGSTAANRLICPGNTDIALSPGESAALVYDVTTGRWRVFGGASGGGGSDAYFGLYF